MYFPYLRGKQYELLALKELAPLLGESGKILPVIEPVKTPDGGLERCLEALWTAEVNPIVVMNPTVGEVAVEGISPVLCDFVNAHPLQRFRLGLIITEATDASRLLDEFERGLSNQHELVLIHEATIEESDFLLEESRRLGRRFDLISDEFKRRRFSKFLTDSTGVVMHDGFPVEARNAAYLSRSESEFSDDFLYYEEEGWGGFGDYLTVGKGWAEGGFTPRAVAIHWTYEPAVGSPIKIRHFTSETNGDIANVGGKFLEAAGKLAAFLDRENIHTLASEVMRQHVRDGTYPGLGIVKKLSIQNHLELMATVLGRS